MIEKQKLGLIGAAVAVGLVAITLTFWTTGSETGIEEEADNETGITLIALNDQQIANSNLSILPVNSGSVQVVASLPGKIILNADRHAHIVPEASGLARVASKNLGDSVQAGEVLAILESRDIAQIKSNYIANLRREALAKNTFQREEGLYQKKVTSEAEYLKAKGDLEAASIERELSQQQLRALGFTDEKIAALPTQPASELRSYELLAPFAGTIVDRDISAGELVHAGTAPFVIADLSTVWVEIGVYPQDIGKVKQGESVEIVGARPNQKAVGRVIFLSPIIDAESRTARAIAEVDNQDGQWHPGTFVRVNVVTDHVDAPFMVPKSAVQRIEGRDVVFVQRDTGFEVRPVTTGACDGCNIEVTDGLQQGDSCATSNTFVLKSELLKGDGEDD